ncbi:MAG: beta-N-acetylhexosaminidase [Haloechinothrix sp.]
MPALGTDWTAHTIRAGYFALLGVSAMLLAACTSDGAPAPPRPTVTPAPTTAPPAVQLPADTPLLTSVIPKPVRVEPDKRANFPLDTATEIRARGEAAEVAGYLRELLRPAVGSDLPVTGSDETGGGAIVLRLADDPALSGEGYRLEVARDGITLTAAEAAGLFAGAQTLRQLLHPDIEDGKLVAGAAVAGGTITDRPRFAYRGAMLDVARHFFGVDVVKRHIDRIAQYKINHLHLHLADDQGWRIEIKSWPKLTEVGGKTEVGGGKGGYYTQDEYRDIVAYAASRGVTVVPEIDMPGHTNAALSAYPELNCSGKAPAQYTGTQVGFSSLCIDKEITYQFVRDVLGELAALTTGEFLHIGGDEATSTSPADYRAFFDKVLPMIGAEGKRVLGWHEYAEAQLPDTAVVQYWRIEATNEPVRKAAQAGRQVLMSPANKTYLDMKYFESDPWGNKWAGPVSVRTAYDWDPAGFLHGVGEESILGVETPLWTELVESEEDVERMAFPRIPAIAEVGWSAQSAREWPEFSERLAAHASRLNAQGIDFHRSPDVPW